MSDFTEEEVTDWYLIEGSLAESVVYVRGRKGAHKLHEGLHQFAEMLMNVAQAKEASRSQQGKRSRKMASELPGAASGDSLSVSSSAPLIQGSASASAQASTESIPGSMVGYRIQLRNMNFRVHVQKTLEAKIYVMRQMRKVVPKLTTRDTGLPTDLINILAEPRFTSQGGLFLVCGTTGSGKSTTCAAIVKARIEQLGVFCLTVEAPPEFELEGVYPSGGFCVQVEAEEDRIGSQLKAALRCYPATQQGSTLFVGEILDAVTLDSVIRSSLAGHFVVSTFHASDPISAISRLLSMLGAVMSESEARDVLSIALRGVMHMSITPDVNEGRPVVQLLISTDSSSAVASQIRTGSVQMLSSELNSQHTLVRQAELHKKLYK